MRLDRFEVAESAIGGPAPSDGWIPAVVPGGVHESLLAAGRIEDPYYDRNERSVRWVEERDWWFRAQLPAAPVEQDERVRLVFEGLDTVVDVWLDGTLLGHHENMFRPAEFDVTGRSGELLLRFSPPLAGLEAPRSATDMFARLGDVFAALAPEEGAAQDAADGGQDGEEASGLMSEALPLSTLRRKATFSWGWDFGPRVPSVGIWRPVEVVRERRAALTGHHVRTLAVDGTTARVAVGVEVDAFATSAALEARVVLTSPSGTAAEVRLPVVAGAGSAELDLVDAEPWWTHDLGDPSLYAVRVELREGEDVLDAVDDRIGIRTIAIDRSPDEEGGRLFRFLLNGVPVFARGAAWLPPTMLVGSITAERRRELVRLAVDGSMNMLRVWGGGIYEDDAFYTACDEAGVLVWQDFAFACIDYPSEDPALQQEVALEAEYQVRRLRNRASLAVWSGNNEVQLIHGFAYQGYEPGNWGWDFFHRILPEAVERFDGGTPYWPGSPWGEDAEEGFAAVNGVRDGDRHAWEVWHGLDFGAGGGDFASVGESRLYRRYARDRGKFISEFGIHAAPELGTLERWIPEASLSIHSPSFDAHNKDNPKDKHDPVLEIVTGIPGSVPEYVQATMVSQAEGLKFGIEHYRRRQPHCSGTLVWQFNDVWPGFSWSVIDYDLVPKAGYWFLQRAFAPVVASFRYEDDRLELWLSNAGRATSTTATVTLERFDGTVEVREEVAADLPAGDSRPVWSTTVAADPGLVARVTGEGFPTNRMFFAEVKDLPLTGGVRSNVEDLGGGEAVVHVEAQGYAYLVHVPSPQPGVRFDTNYVDLRDGERLDIRVSNLPAGVDPASLAARTYSGPRVPVVG